jgi:hypothetical protein
MIEQKLKELLAEAMYAGGLVGEKGYGGLVDSKKLQGFVRSITKLEQMLQNLAAEDGFAGINVEKILPLYKEIEIVTKLN